MLTTGIEGVLFYQRRQVELNILGKAPPIRQGIASRQLSATTAKPDRGLAVSKKISLTQGKFAIVDDADFEWLNQWKWHHSGGYARRNIRQKAGKKKSISMHRLIMNPPPDMDIDHANGHGLDNRRRNLRFCTCSQNLGNSRKWKRATSSRYKGVSWACSRHKWQAHIQSTDKRHSLGRFDNEEEAARAYNIAAKKAFGVFARLNVIEAE